MSKVATKPLTTEDTEEHGGESPLFERVYDTNPVDLSWGLQVFSEKHTTAGLLGSPQDQSIPKSKTMKPVQIDGGQDVGNFGSGNIEFGKQFDLPTCDARIHVQLLGDGYEILLQHLQGNDSGSRSPMFGYQGESTPLFGWSGFVVRIDENVGIEETTSAHESRPG